MNVGVRVIDGETGVAFSAGLFPLGRHGYPGAAPGSTGQMFHLLKKKKTLVAAETMVEVLLDVAEDVASLCDVCQAFDEAHRSPTAAMSSVSAFNENVPAGPPFLDDVIPPRDMDLCPEKPLSVRILSIEPLDGLGLSAASRISVLGEPRRIQLDAGEGEW